MRWPWIGGALAFVGTAACIPDVNVTGIRGEAGSGAPAGNGGSAGSGASSGGGSGASTAYQVGYTGNTPHEVTHPGAGSDCIDVQCPPGFYVTQGGGYWPTRMGGVDQVVLENNSPADLDRWQLCGVTADVATHKWLVETFCADFITQPVERSSTHTGSGRDCLTVDCPAGLEVVGGGAVWDGGFDKIRLDSSRPSADNAWTICGYADQAGHGWTVKAICAEIDVTIDTKTDTHLGGSDCIQHTCPAGQVAVGGGGEWETSATAAGGWLGGFRPTATMAGPVGMTLCAERTPGDSGTWAVDVLCTADAVPILPD